MSVSSFSSSQKLRESLGHPVVDGDGHCLEFEPELFGYIRRELGDADAKRVESYVDNAFAWYGLTPDQRKERQMFRPPWGLNGNLYDMATAMAPKLMYSRLDEFGFDYAIVVPTLGGLYSRIPIAELRRPICRALNRYYRDVGKEFADRMTYCALIPMTTPEEAVAELEHAVNELGHKAIVTVAGVRRPVPALAHLVDAAPAGTGSRLTYWDFFGEDSPYNYDPVWQKCVDLGVAVGSHFSGNWGSRLAVNNYSSNHIGAFSASGEALAKSLFFNGVTHRFPTLNFGFYEGGAHWAGNLYLALIEHWEKRAGDNIDKFRRSAVDDKELISLLRKHGSPRMQELITDDVDGMLPHFGKLAGWSAKEEDFVDDFAKANISSKDDFDARFVERFYFGCEAEDPSVAGCTMGTFRGRRLNAIFGSDIGHWDVPDMTGVLLESFELVEDGLLDRDAYRRFTCDNIIRMHGLMNPKFFDGTVVSSVASQVLAGDSSS